MNLVCPECGRTSEQPAFCTVECGGQQGAVHPFTQMVREAPPDPLPANVQRVVDDVLEGLK